MWFKMTDPKLSRVRCSRRFGEMCPEFCARVLCSPVNPLPNGFAFFFHQILSLAAYFFRDVWVLKNPKLPKNKKKFVNGLIAALKEHVCKLSGSYL